MLRNWKIKRIQHRKRYPVLYAESHDYPRCPPRKWLTSLGDLETAAGVLREGYVTLSDRNQRITSVADLKAAIRFGPYPRLRFYDKPHPDEKPCLAFFRDDGSAISWEGVRINFRKIVTEKSFVFLTRRVNAHNKWLTCAITGKAIPTFCDEPKQVKTAPLTRETL